LDGAILGHLPTSQTRALTHFWHPTTQKLYELIKRSTPDQATAETRTLLEDIAQRCRTCQALSRKPYRFKVSMPENVVFNQTLAMDIMYLEGKALLHVVDTSTNFSNAIFLQSQSVESIWLAFLECWATLFIGLPDKIRTDSGSVLTSDKWNTIMNESGIVLQLSGVEHHNGIGQGETYHSALRRVYSRVRHDYPTLPETLSLRFACKALNDTANSLGLVPSLLVYGVLPRFPMSRTELPDQQTRMAAMATARTEMETWVAQQRITTALHRQPPPAADYVFSVNDSVWVFRETNSSYVPAVVHSLDETGKMVIVRHANGSLVRYSRHQLKPMLPVQPAEFETAFVEHLCSIGDHEHDSSSVSVFLSEAIQPCDPKFSSPEAVEARSREIAGLVQRGTWEVTLRSELPSSANVLDGRFVMTIKDTGTDRECVKARYVIKGHKDVEKQWLVHNSPSLRQGSIKLLVALAAIFGFRIWSLDVSQAYLQSAETLMRDVYLDPKHDRDVFHLSSEQCLKLLRPLYGLADSGDYWHSTFLKHTKSDLEMITTFTDASFFFHLSRAHALNGLCSNSKT
jgi:hypothetical protein